MPPRRCAQGIGCDRPGSRRHRAPLIFGANVLLQRPLIDSLLFSLAIAVGITPQLLPTGTLTEGLITFTAALAVDESVPVDTLALFGLLATEIDYATDPVSTVGLNAMDAALWQSGIAASAGLAAYTQIDLLPFDHHRRMASALVDAPDGRRLMITKGSPESARSAHSSTSRLSPSCSEPSTRSRASSAPAGSSSR